MITYRPIRILLIFMYFVNHPKMVCTPIPEPTRPQQTCEGTGASSKSPRVKAVGPGLQRVGANRQGFYGIFL